MTDLQWIQNLALNEWDGLLIHHHQQLSLPWGCK